MSADDLRTRAREAAAEAHPEPWPGMVPMAQFSYAEGYEAGYLAHAAQQPSIDVDELALVIERASDTWWNDLSDDGPSVGEYGAAAVKAWLTGEEIS